MIPTLPLTDQLTDLGDSFEMIISTATPLIMPQRIPAAVILQEDHVDPASIPETGMSKGLRQSVECWVAAIFMSPISIAIKQFTMFD